MEEQIDKVVIHGEVELEEAIRSLRFYYNLMKSKNPYGNYLAFPLRYELHGQSLHDNPEEFLRLMRENQSSNCS